MALRSLLTALVLALTALLSPLTPTLSHTPPAQAAPAAPAARVLVVHVAIRDMAFSPSSLSVRRGRTVTWTNRDPFAHSVVVTRGPRLFHSPLLQPGQSFSHTFRVAGTYRYKCGVHPMMRGTVRVR
jgi:plastocyanin